MTSVTGTSEEAFRQPRNFVTQDRPQSSLSANTKIITLYWIVGNVGLVLVARSDGPRSNETSHRVLAALEKNVVCRIVTQVQDSENLDSCIS